MDNPSQSREILQKHLDKFLSSREPPKTFCPSEIARALSRAELQIVGVSEWRELMPEIRGVIAEIRDRGEVEVLQKGEVLDGDLGVGLEGVKGPIRVRRRG
jgi:hypothetical protein